MTANPLTVDELVQRCYDRYTAGFDASSRRRIDELITNDTPTALIRFLTAGLERQDLQADEVEAALKLAEQRKLLKASNYLLQALTDYASDHSW